MVAGDAGGTLRVQHVLLITKPQHEPVTLHEGDTQYDVLGDFLITVSTQLDNVRLTFDRAAHQRLAALGVARIPA